MKEDRRSLKIFGIVFMTILTLIMFLAFMPGIGVRPFGEISYRSVPTDDYYIEHGIEDVGAYNIVTTVVFDYRGYDTLGEATVLFTALTGAAALLLGGRRHGEE